MAMLWWVQPRRCPNALSNATNTMRYVQVRNAAVLFNVLDAISSLTMSCRQGQDAVAAAGAALGHLAATTPAAGVATGATAEAASPTKDAEPGAEDSGSSGNGNSVLALLASMLGSRHTVLTSKVRMSTHLHFIHKQ